MKILQILLLLFSAAVLVNAQMAVLTGSTYDANGSLIIGSKVTAVNQKGEKFETVTNSKGVYFLTLPFNLYDGKNTKNFRVSKYDVVVAANGFETFVLKDFKFVPSSTGKMNLDIALDVEASDGAINVEIPKEKNKKNRNN